MEDADLIKGDRLRSTRVGRIYKSQKKGVVGVVLITGDVERFVAKVRQRMPNDGKSPVRCANLALCSLKGHL